MSKSSDLGWWTCEGWQPCNCLRMPEARRFQESRMPGNPLVRFDEGRVGRTRKVSPSLLLYRSSAAVFLGGKVRMTHTRSGGLFRRAVEKIPGGVISPVRAFRAVGGQPLFIARGEGSHLFDVDGNEYIDYVGSWGPLILGHRHPEILAALEKALGIGTSFGAPTEQEILLADAICDAVPSIEMVRLVNSGTEATMSAIRLARGFTGRDLTVKFEGCYHGHVDSLLVKAGSGMATLGIAD